MERKVWLRIAGVFAVFMTGIGLVLGGAELFGVGDLVTNEPFARMVANIVLAFVVSGLILVYGQTVGGVPVRALRFGWNRRATLFVLVASIVTLGIGAGYMLALRQAGLWSFSVVMPSLATLLFGLIGEFGVLHEEVHNRGYLLALLQQHMGIGGALVFGAVYFMLGHIPFKGLDFMLFSNLLGGLVYGYLYLKSGSLTVAVVAHALHNLTTDLFLTGNSNGVSVGIATFQFGPRLEPLARIGFDVTLTALMLGVIYFFYVRGTPLLEPAAGLQERWSEIDQRAVGTVQSRPVL